MLSSNEHINPGKNQEYIAAYSCSIFILQGQDEYFKNLEKKQNTIFPSLRAFLQWQLPSARKNGKKFLLIGKNYDIISKLLYFYL